jgi:membrane protein
MNAAVRIFQNLDRLDLRGIPRWERTTVRVVQFLAVTWTQFKGDRVIIRASGLAYATLLAAVPLVAVGFALFPAFGAFDDVKQKVQDFLFDQLLPTSHEEILAYFNQFTEGASRLGLIGFLFLVFAAVLLLDNIESNFNQIWHVTARRKLVAKITAYTSVLVFGTLLIGASLTISARIKAALFRGLLFDPGTLQRLGSWLFPMALSVLAFLLMYLVVPFTRVRFRSALLGAAVGGILWEVSKNFFATSVGQSVRYSTIYGSLATIPIFLIWLYVTWILVLLGLEVAFTSQHFAALVRTRSLAGRAGGDRVSTALHLYALIAKRFHRGGEPPTIDELAQRFLLSTASVESHVDRLVRAGLARHVETSSGDDGVMPARSLSEVEVAQVIDPFVPGGQKDPDHRPIERAVEDVVAQFNEAGFKALGRTSVEHLVERLEKEGDE